MYFLIMNYQYTLLKIVKELTWYFLMHFLIMNYQYTLLKIVKELTW